MWSLRLLPLLLVPALSQAQSDPLITYTTQCVPMERAFEEISKSVKRPVRVHPSMAKEPIALRLRDVSLKEVQAKIADAVSAEWLQTKDGPMLVRSAALTSKLENERAQGRLESVRESLNALKKPLEQPLDAQVAKERATAYADLLALEKQAGSTADFGIRYRELDDAGAESRLMRRMLVSIGAERIAGMRRGLYVFTHQPNAVQLQVPGDVAAELDRYVQERNTLADAISSIPASQSTSGYSSNLRLAGTPVHTHPKALLKLLVDSSTNSITSTIHVYDGQRWMGTAYARLDTALAYPDYVKERTRLAKTPDRLQVSPEITEVCSRLTRAINSSDQPALSNEAVRILTDAENFDPLRLSMSEVLLKEAEKENLNLVAYASDNSYYPCFFHGMRVDSSGAINPNLYNYVLTTQGATSLEKADGWLIAKPKDPLEATETRMDRTAIGKFLSAVANQRYAGLEDWADLAAAHDNDPAINLLTIARCALEANLRRFETPDWSTLRLYGSLNEAQVRQLVQGGSIVAGSLSNDQLGYLQDLVFGGGAAGIFDTSGTESPDPRTAEGKLANEPTEAAPNGIQGQMSLRMVDKRDPTLFVTMTGNWNVKDYAMPIESVAEMIAVSEMPDLFPKENQAHFSGAVYGERREIYFSLTLSPRQRLVTALEEESKPMGQPIPVQDFKDRLPKAIWERLSKLIEQRKTYFLEHKEEIKKESGGVAAPPPSA